MMDRLICHDAARIESFFFGPAQRTAAERAGTRHSAHADGFIARQFRAIGRWSWDRQSGRSDHMKTNWTGAFESRLLARDLQERRTMGTLELNAWGRRGTIQNSGG